MITNVYANEYIKYLYEMKMQDISTLKKFVGVEKEKKLGELNEVETQLEDFKNRHGFVDLESYSQNVVDRINEDKNQIVIAQAEVETIDKTLKLLKVQLSTYDSSLVDYMQLQLDQASLLEIQKNINTLELQEQFELSKAENENIKKDIKQNFTDKLKILNELKDKQAAQVLNKITSDSPTEKNGLIQRVFELNLRKISNDSKIYLLKSEIYKNEKILSTLPDLNIELAKIKRNLSTNENLYTQLEEKYQEAQIMERTRVGDAYILDPGNDYSSPVSPNHSRILTIGIVGGLFLGFLFVFFKNYFDRSIKNPDEIEKKGISLLSFIPSVKILKAAEDNKPEFIVLTNRHNDTNAESFKVLRTRVQFSKLDSSPLKTILVTSSIPGEGKTFITVNLASSFAIANKKTIILDCDLRKPRVHTLFNLDKRPGLTDYLFNRVTLEEVIRKTENENLSYITSGTIPPNPSELLDSDIMKEFLCGLKNIYDYIIVDSAPFISVTDSEILYNIIDGTILIAKADVTPADIFIKTHNRMTELNSHNFLGAVLNDFKFTKHYGYNYNYYYYYTRTDGKKVKKLKKIKEDYEKPTKNA